MAATLRRVTEGSIPTCNKGKRKVVDIAEVKQRYKFKEDPLIMEVALEIEAMRR